MPGAPYNCVFEFEDDGRISFEDSGGKVTVSPQTSGLAFEALLGLSSVISRSSPENCDRGVLRLVGHFLYEFLLPASEPKALEKRSDIKVRLDSGQRVHLHLLFRTEAGRYAQLPWEFLRVPASNEHDKLKDVGTDRLTVTRYIPQQRSMGHPDDTLRVLVDVASPDGQAEIAYDRLLSTLSSLEAEAAGKLEYRLERNRSLAQIEADLKAYRPDVFHFTGHGEPNGLWFAGTEPTYLEQLARLDMSPRPFGFDAPNAPVTEAVQAGIDAVCDVFSRLEHKPTVVILDACHSDWSWLSELLPGVAHQLVEHVPAVIAMRYPISNDASETFSVALYQAMLAGRPLDECVDAARAQLRAATSGSFAEQRKRAAGTPVLYLRDSTAVCKPLVHDGAEPAAETRGPSSGQPVAPCPACEKPGLWTGSRCSSCGIPFMCPTCAHEYTEANLRGLRFCPGVVAGKPCPQTYREGEFGPQQTAAPAPTPQPHLPDGAVSGATDIRTFRFASRAG